MSVELSQIERYLRETVGIEVRPTQWGGGKRLPAFLRDLYSFYQLQLLDASCLLMLDRSEKEQSPASIRKHRDQVQIKWDGELVYVRERITAYNRKRLIEHKVSFLVPGNQMYLPMLGIDLREHFKKLRYEIREFSPSTQALIIHALLHKTEKSVFTPTEMADCLGYSTMTMSRAFNELNSVNIGETTIEGRDRCLRIVDSAKDVWEKAKRYLRSPVKKRLHIGPLTTELPGPIAGLTALAQYSMLAEPANSTIALSGENWKELKQVHQVIELPSSEPGALEIEVWRYAPGLFSKGNVVDRLSLYLSLKESRDERIEASLEEMMKGLGW
jgi:hypothetical protein